MSHDPTAYMREYRSRPAVREAELARRRARDRALARLAAEYPERYRALYVVELNREDA
jgi:hypothetical protein